MSLWQLCLAIWLLLYGFLAITNIRFEQQNFVMGLLAIVTAVLIFFSNRRVVT